MNQGMIMSLNKRTAVVLTPDGQFIRVKRQPHFVIGGEIIDSGTLRAVPRIRQRILQASVMTSALIICLFGVWMLRTPPVVAYVSMDINPSIELGLDAKERVRELRAVNADADAIIYGLKYKGKDLEVVMNEIAHKLIEKQILTIDDPEVVIASVPIKELAVQWEIEVTEKMTRILNEAALQEEPENRVKLEVTTVSLPAEIRDEAEANGVSSGKMAFWLVSESQGHEVSLESLKEQSLKKIAASWGGVNKVMSQYEQKKPDDKVNVDKADKADEADENGKDNKVDNANKTDNADKTDKNNKNDKVDEGKSEDKSNGNNKKSNVSDKVDPKEKRNDSIVNSDKKDDDKEDEDKNDNEDDKQQETKKNNDEQDKSQDNDQEDDNQKLNKDNKDKVNEKKEQWMDLLDEAKMRSDKTNSSGRERGIDKNRD